MLAIDAQAHIIAKRLVIQWWVTCVPTPGHMTTQPSVRIAEPAAFLETRRQVIKVKQAMPIIIRISEHTCGQHRISSNAEPGRHHDKARGRKVGKEIGVNSFAPEDTFRAYQQNAFV